MPADTTTPVSTETPPQETAKSPSNKMSIVIPIIAVVFLLANVGLFLYLQYVTNKQNTPVATIPAPTQATTSATSPTPTFTPKPTPTPFPLAQGKITYNGGHGKGFVGSQITSVTFDPLDPKKGAQQTVSVGFSASSPVLSADLILTTDTKTATYSMQKNAQDPTGNSWLVVITTDDTHLYKYTAQVTIKTATDKDSQTITIR